MFEASRAERFRPALRWLPALLAALATLAVYASAAGFGFVWDDQRLIVNNPLIRTWPGLGRALVADFWLTAGEQSSGFWRPLITLSYAVETVVFRGQAWGFHLVNALVAAAVSALVVLCAQQLGVPALAALLAGLWFAVMPHHVESVAWIAGRTDVFCAAFLLLALWLDGRDAAARRRRPGLGALLALAGALLCKEAAVLFALVVLARAWCERRVRFGAALRWIAPYLALTLVYLVVHFVLVPTPVRPHFLSPGLLHRGQLSTALMLSGYLSFLSPFATHTPAVVIHMPATWREPAFFGGLVIHLAAIVAIVAALRRRSRWAMPLLLLWLTLLPTFVANLFAGTLLYSERFFFLPSIGAAWLLALGLDALARRGRVLYAAGATLTIALVACAAVVTLRTLPDWRNEDVLFASMTVKQPRNAMGWVQLARLRFVQGREAETERALATLERIETVRPEILTIRALISYRHGRWDEVASFTEQATALDPTLIEPRIANATALLRLGRLDEAQQAIAGLQTLVPGNPMVAGLEGQRLLTLRRPEEAQPLLELATRWVKDDPDLWYALGMTHAYRRELPGARAAFTECVRVDPQLYDGWLRLATACHLLGDDAGRDAALSHAAALPDAADGRVAELRARLDATPR